MSKYVLMNNTFVEVDGDRLIHRQTLNTSSQQSKKNFKYYAKVTSGKTTRYFYSRDEWLAYKQNQKTTQTSATKNETIMPPSTPTSAAALVMRGASAASALLKSDGNYTWLLEEESEPDNEHVDVTKMDPQIRRYREFLARRIVADKKSEQESPKSWDELAHKDREYTKEEDQAETNPNYDPSWMAYSQNCANCTLAYDARRRGYDVEAAPYNQYETFQPLLNEITTWYTGITEDDWIVNRMDTTSDDVYDRSWQNEPGRPDFVTIGCNETKSSIASMPDNSYGQYCVYWSTGGAHSMVWEKTNDNIILRDCQTNKTYDYDEYAKQWGSYMYKTCVLRTDNLELTDDSLRRIRNKKKED